MDEVSTCLMARVRRLENALRFYATAQVIATKKVAFDDGLGDCAGVWIQDDGQLAREALGMDPPPLPRMESSGEQLDIETIIEG